MDNDNKLVQKAADVYRSLRFAMKYRGLTILSAEDGNNAITAAVTAGAPYMAARCGATEMRTAADYLQNGGTGFAERTRQDIRNLSGVFPTDDATLAKFCRTYIECAHTADLLALWNVGAEREVVRGCGPATRYTKLRALEPYYHPHPWSAALAGKRVALFGAYGWGDGEWMRSWEARCASKGISLAAESVICQEAPDGDALERCRALGRALAK